jgi:hypothetical protein
LRRAPRTPDQVEAVLAKLAVAIVTPGAVSTPPTPAAVTTSG